MQPDREVEAERALMQRFYDALSNNDLQGLKGLISSGVNLECVNDSGQTPLIMACYLGADFELVQALLDAGSSIAAKDADGRTALMAAAFKGSISVVDLLLERGANVNEAGLDGRNSLMSTCEFNTAEDWVMFNHLKDRGADIHLVDVEGNTALAVACKNSSLKCAMRLMELGADPNGRDHEGVTPLMHASANIFEVDNAVRNALHQAGAAVDVQDNKGFTPLMLACMNDRPIAVQWLLEHAGDLLGRTNHSGRTARDIAAERGLTRCLQIIDAFDAARHAREALSESEPSRNFSFSATAGLMFSR